MLHLWYANAYQQVNVHCTLSVLERLNDLFFYILQTEWNVTYAIVDFIYIYIYIYFFFL